MSELRITAPLEGRTPTPFGVYDVGSSGYRQREHIVSGTASSFRATGPWEADGQWGAEADSQAGFTTRIVVHEPLDPARFSGTVVLEWLNVSSGTDLAPGWTFAHRELLRSGDVHIGVSAQRAGIEGGGLIPGPT